jgi:hypothetical protein
LLLDSLHYSTKFPPTDYVSCVLLPLHFGFRVELENNLIAFWDAQVNTKKSPSTLIEGGQYYMALGGVSVGVIG